MDGTHGAGSTDDDDNHVDKASVIHLLRVFVGAVEREEPDSQSPPPRRIQCSTTNRNEASGGVGDESSPSRKRPRFSSAPQPVAERQPSATEEEDGDRGSLAGNGPTVVRTATNAGQHDDPTPPPATPAKVAGNSSVSARIDAGCMLWDMSVEETRVAVMHEAGLIPVVVTVLQCCRSCSRAEGAAGEAGAAAVAGGAAAPEAAESDAITGEAKGGIGVDAETERDCVPVGEVDDVERLREVACGLLANACYHRSLRQHFFGDAALSEELIGVFHSIDDPACLTELLRLFSIAAMAAAVPASRKQDVDTEARIQGLGEGLVTEETLERLGFFLANSLEEKLLAQACSLTYSLMYRFGDDVIYPLVEKCRLEESLASLLATRSTDLSYERLGGAETGLDYLLRCLEVLSTSEMSSIGPLSLGGQQPPAAAAGDNSRSNSNSWAASERGGTCLVSAVISGDGAADPDPATASANADVLDSAAREPESVASVPCAAQMGTAEVFSEVGPTAPGGKLEAVENSDNLGQTAPESELAGDAEGRKFVVDHVIGDENGGDRAGVRKSVIRGLIRILEPWEHTRRTQRTALLVLGNVLENVLEAATGGPGAEQVSGLVRETVWGLEEGFAAGDSGGDPLEGCEEADDRGDRHDRRRTRTAHFVESMVNLVGEEEPSPGENDIGEELAEASAVVRKMLEFSPPEV